MKNTLAMSAKTQRYTAHLADWQAALFAKWQALSEDEKEARRREANAQDARAAAAKHAERVKLSRIPKAFQDAMLADDTRQTLSELESGKLIGVVLRGATGRGKTTAACAMLSAHLQNGLGSFTTMNDLLHRVRGAYSSGENSEEVFGIYRGTPLLVLDDLGKENVSADSITRLFELLDARINNKRPTIVTTQFQNNELLKRYRGKVDDREMIAAVLSRLALFRTIEFQGIDRRLK